MGRHIMDLGTAVLAAIIVMIVHELSKTIIYCLRYKEETKGSLRYALPIYHYIDPIGLICCVAGYGGFSKPYLYRIRDKKINQLLCISGFLSLIGMAVLSIAALKLCFHVSYTDGGLYYNAAMPYKMVLLMHLCFNIAFISIGMLVVNLFPVASFDMGNLIAGISVAKFFEYVRKDIFLKMAVILCIIMDIPKVISQTIVCILL